MVTEREKQLLLRAGFIRGVNVAHRDYNAVRLTKAECGLYLWMESINAPGLRVGEIETTAAREYPLPKVPRPRVVRDQAVTHAFEFRLIDGQLQERYILGKDESRDGEWHDATNFGYGPHICRLIADLVAQPVELVEDDGSSHPSSSSSEAR